MKSENMNKYLLLFCYVLFSFAVAVPEKPMNVYSWLNRIAVSSVVMITLITILFKQRELKKYTCIIICLYLFLLMAKQISSMYSYIRLYHQQMFNYAEYIASAFAVIMIYSIKENRIYQLALPFVSITVILIVFIFFLNYSKFNPASLYIEYKAENTGLYGVTLFDYLIPMYLLFNGNNKKIKTKGISFVFITDFVLILFIIFIFGCIKGDLLYSLSPLQAMFQISGTAQMKNYDAIFNMMLYFPYYSSVAVIISVYKKVKQQIGIKSKSDIAFIIPAMLLIDKINSNLWMIIHFIVIVLIITGRKSQKYEKI